MRLPRVSRLAVVTLIATTGLIAFGGFTRGSDSGYGCRDRWPLCENGLLGGLLPRMEYHMVIEWTHRWLAAVVGLLAVLTAIGAWRRLRAHRTVVAPAVAAVVVIGFQAWLGRQVVKGDLDKDLVSIHLAVSFLVLALLAVLAITARRAEASKATGSSGLGHDRRWTWMLASAAVGAYVVALLGSYVHNLYIPGWPLVDNNVFPDLSNRFVAVHYLHRTVVLIALVALAYLARDVVRRSRPVAERYLVWGAGAAFAVNVGLGAAHVFTKVSSSLLVMAHLGLAAIVWASLVSAATAAYLPEPTPVEDGKPTPVTAG
jgi:cytochrome c oxidase assembly protein subunit 15